MILAIPFLYLIQQTLSSSKLKTLHWVGNHPLISGIDQAVSLFFLKGHPRYEIVYPFFDRQRRILKWKFIFVLTGKNNENGNPSN